MGKKRWNPEDKIRIVLESLNTNITIAELCIKYQITPVLFYSWRQKFIDGGKTALSTDRRTNRNNDGNLAAENDRLKKLIGELTIANDALKKRWREAKDDGSLHHATKRNQPEKITPVFRMLQYHVLLQKKEKTECDSRSRRTGHDIKHCSTQTVLRHKKDGSHSVSKNGQASQQKAGKAHILRTELAQTSPKETRHHKSSCQKTSSSVCTRTALGGRHDMHLVWNRWMVLPVQCY